MAPHRTSTFDLIWVGCTASFAVALALTLLAVGYFYPGIREIPSLPIVAPLPSLVASPPSESLWRSLTVTFLTVFVAEMGDKTQLATLLMSAQSRSPWGIFLGSAGALVTASLLSVLLGGALAQFIPPELLQTLAGTGFVAIGSYVLWGEWRTRQEDGDVA